MHFIDWAIVGALLAVVVGADFTLKNIPKVFQIFCPPTGARAGIYYVYPAEWQDWVLFRSLAHSRCTTVRVLLSPGGH